jgi:predicted nucleotidyltransferase
MFGQTENELRILEDLAIYKLKSAGAKVWAFRSRSRGDYKKFSDIDLLYQVKKTLPSGLIFEITSTLEESDLPYKVDIVSLNDLAESYLEGVLLERREV